MRAASVGGRKESHNQGMTLQEKKLVMGGSRMELESAAGCKWM